MIIKLFIQEYRRIFFIYQNIESSYKDNKTVVREKTRKQVAFFKERINELNENNQDTFVTMN